MSHKDNDVALGRFLSLVLRHQPSAAHIKLDEHGWADVNLLLAGCRRAGKPLDLEDLERIVEENAKQRYCFNEDHTLIRANQGHSISVDVELQKKRPPDRLFHGTASRFLESIRNHGIMAMSRRYVHLSADEDTAQKVGSRHGQPIVLVIDAAGMQRDGFTFYCSVNGVWLCKSIPWKYVQEEIR